MKIRKGNIPINVARLLLALIVLFACLTRLPESAQAQRPAPIPVEPERVELGGGKYKLVYRTQDGRVYREEEFVGGVRVSYKYVYSFFPNGEAADAAITRYDPFKGVTGHEEIKYDKFGRPQERTTYDTWPNPKSYRREKWNQKSQKWEPAPERQRWNREKGTWEEVPEDEWFSWSHPPGRWTQLPKGERINPENGEWERINPKTGQWESVLSPPTPTPPSDSSNSRATSQPDNARATLEPVDGIKRSTSASPGYGAENTVANGLSVVQVTTPQGTIYLNLPSTIETGDNISGTLVTEPKGEDPKQRTKNERELSEYVVEFGQQRSAISEGGALKLTVPSVTTYLILRDKKGREVCRSEVPVASSLPEIADFKLPTLGQQGHAIEIVGIFDGKFETTRIRIGGQEVPPIAESRQRLIVRNTAPLVGLTEIEIREGDQVRRGPFRSLGIQLSAPKLSLLRGEGTTLTILVTGLEDLRESIPLDIENRSPGVIALSPSNFQRVMIAPGDVRQGSYTTERALTGIQRGGFTITATVTRKD